MRFAVRQLLIAIVLLLATSAWLLSAQARVQETMLCVDPDIEYPVPCDEDD
jgi:hypothetical protein